MRLSLTNAELLPESTRNAFDAVLQPLNGIGVWRDQPFDMTHYSANGNGTLAATAVNVVTFRYMVIDRTLFMALYLNSITVGGTPSTQLRVLIPGGHVAARTTETMYRNFQGVTGTVAHCMTTTDSPFLAFYKDASENNWSTGAVFIRASLCFEIR